MSFYESDQKMSETATAGGVSCCSLVGTGLVVMVQELGHGMERGELHLRRPFNATLHPTSAGGEAGVCRRECLCSYV